MLSKLRNFTSWIGAEQKIWKCCHCLEHPCGLDALALAECSVLGIVRRHLLLQVMVPSYCFCRCVPGSLLKPSRKSFRVHVVTAGQWKEPTKTQKTFWLSSRANGSFLLSFTCLSMNHANVINLRGSQPEMSSQVNLFLCPVSCPANSLTSIP